MWTIVRDMELGRPLAVVTSSVDGDVLRVLALAEQDFTPGAVHSLLGRYSVAGVRRSLVRLAEQGIVTRRPAGRAFLFGLNREHLAADPVIALARTRERLLDRLTATVAQWRVPTIYGAVFGSAARADQRPDSDLDILVIHPMEPDRDTWAEQVADLSRHATAWTGNDARILSYDPQDIRVTAAPDPILVSVVDEGLQFAGEPGWLRQQLRANVHRRTQL
jgi:predicted nucleotidyltransferase